MNQPIVILIAVFAGEVLLLLLAGWIFSYLERHGVFGMDLRVRRAGAVIFVLLPVLCGLILLPAVLLASSRIAGSDPDLIPGVGIFPGGEGTSGARPGKIVYTCQVFHDMTRDQICIMNADGSGQRRLTRNDRGDYNFPSLAPDGGSVVFVGDEGQGYEIFEMELDGEARQLSQGMANASAPEISPDGRSIVFSQTEGGNQSIWIMDRDGGDPRQVFGPPLGSGWDPVWSPDGDQILFASNLDGPVQLYTIRADGGGLRQVTQLEGIRGRNDWSVDGRIATYAGTEWMREIFISDRPAAIQEGDLPLQAGDGLNQITQGGNNLAPSFSPDGEWIAFTSYRDRYRDVNGCEIYTMRLDGSDISRLTDNTYCDWQPRWGP